VAYTLINFMPKLNKKNILPTSNLKTNTVRIFWSLLVNKFLQYASLIVIYILISSFADQSSLGIFDYFTTLIALFVNIVLWGQDSAIGRFIVNATSKIVRGRILICSFSLQLGNLICFILIPCLFLKLFRNPLFHETLSIYSATLLFFALFAGLLIDNVFNILKWTLRSSSYILMSIVVYVLPLLIVIVFILNGNSSIITIIWSFVFGRLLSAVFSLLYVPQLISFRAWSLRKFSLITYQLLQYAIPIGFASGVLVLIPFLEKSLIVNSLGFSSLSEFAFAAKIVLALDIFNSLFVGSWLPYIHLINPRKEQIRFFLGKAIETYLFFFLIAYVMVVYVGCLLPHSNFANLYRYTASAKLLVPLGFAVLVNGLSSILVAEFSINKNSIAQFFATCLFGFVYCILLYFGLAHFGLAAIGFAAVAASAMRFLFIYSINSTLCSSDAIYYDLLKLASFVLPVPILLVIINSFIENRLYHLGVLAFSFVLLFIPVAYSLIYGKPPFDMLSTIFRFKV